MSEYTFKLPESRIKKDQKFVTVGDKYTFENGELTVDEDTARKIKPILTRFYACTVTQSKKSQDEAAKAENEDEAVLSKTSTQGSKAKQ